MSDSVYRHQLMNFIIILAYPLMTIMLLGIRFGMVLSVILLCLIFGLKYIAYPFGFYNRSTDVNTMTGSPLIKKILTTAFFLLSFSLFAREVEIIVEDIELGLPLEGAVIRSWDGTEYICDVDGKVIVSVPDDRQVVIQAAYPGYETGRLAVTATGASFILGLRLLDIMEGKELVVEAARPGTSETRTGRSVAVSEQELARTAEIGIIEDVMSTIKLLPGVTDTFNTLPSIRGGEPNDMNAYLDGYYIDNPYQWGGGFSIFDPKMTQSAQLSPRSFLKPLRTYHFGAAGDTGKKALPYGNRI